jgi:uncharacterized protein (DUF433 family)
MKEAFLVSRLDRVTSDLGICHGKPVVRGLRYPVESLLELLAAGMSVEDILDDYPDLEREDLEQVLSEHPDLEFEDIRQALEFAAASLEADTYLELRHSA